MSKLLETRRAAALGRPEPGLTLSASGVLS